MEDPYPGINQVVGHTADHAISLSFTSDEKFIAKVDNRGKDTASFLISL
jgi:hypothetical protein